MIGGSLLKLLPVAAVGTAAAGGPQELMDMAEAALGALCQPIIFVIRQGAVIMALQIGQGCQHKPVGHLCATDKGETG